METAIKRQAAFRLDGNLLDMLRSAARREHRSLNSFVESLLMNAMYTEPNEETKAAIEEAMSGKRLEELDLDHFKEYVASL